jgi:hypothetical protein
MSRVLPAMSWLPLVGVLQPLLSPSRHYINTLPPLQVPENKRNFRRWQIFLAAGVPISGGGLPVPDRLPGLRMVSGSYGWNGRGNGLQAERRGGAPPAAGGGEQPVGSTGAGEAQ